MAFLTFKHQGSRFLQRWTHAGLVAQPDVHVRAVDRRVASRRPAGAHADETGMIDVADIDLPWQHVRACHLRVTPEAEVEVRLDEQLGVDGAVRARADGATLAQRRMLEDDRPGLLPMALSARLIQ